MTSFPRYRSMMEGGKATECSRFYKVFLVLLPFCLCDRLLPHFLAGFNYSSAAQSQLPLLYNSGINGEGTIGARTTLLPCCKWLSNLRSFSAPTALLSLYIFYILGTLGDAPEPYMTTLLAISFRALVSKTKLASQFMVLFWTVEIKVHRVHCADLVINSNSML